MRALDFLFARSLSARGAFLLHAPRNQIEGWRMAFNSTTALDITLGRGAVNGKMFESTGTTTITSGSTMLDISGSTVTIGASKAYFVFAYDNAGALAFRVEERDGTGDGADPTLDSNHDYYKAASTGLAARRIGKFWTNGSSQIIDFDVIVAGRRREVHLTARAAVSVVSSGTSTSYSPVTTTPYITVDDEALLAWMLLTKTSSTGNASGNLAADGGGQDGYVMAASNMTANGILESGSRVLIPNSGALHYKVAGANMNLSVFLSGYVHSV